MATYNPLSTNFKDDILADSNDKRKYTQINNSDGTISLQDSTAYKQVGSLYGAKEVNEEREAINNVYANKLVTLDEIDLVTEEGYFVDAKAVKELNSKTMNLEYASVKRRVDAATLAVGKEYTFEQDCYVYFGASFTSTSGYCRVYVTNENDEIVHYVQINPAPTSANAQTTHEYFAKKWWKIKTGSYGSLYNNVISYSLIY